MPVKRQTFRTLLVALSCALGLWLAASPQPAAAQNVHCEIPFPPPYAFGTSLSQTFTLGFTCRNESSQTRSHTLCLRRGNPQYPAVPPQPAMGMGNNVLLFNLYRAAPGVDEWAPPNYIAKPITLLPGQTFRDTFTFHGQIRAGQTVPNGTYTGIINNTMLGALSNGQCLQQFTNFQGQDVNLSFTANLVPGCTLGAIGPIDFGTRPGLAERVDAAGSVQLTCPLSRGWTLTFGGGNNLAGDIRRMRSVAGDYMPYTLYRDSNRNNPIAVNGTITGSGTGTAQTTPVYGRIEPATPPAVGEYRDSVVVTLSF